MLSKGKRLNLKFSFRWVRSGDRIDSPLWQLYYRFGDTIEPRVGISLKTSVFPKANLRNKARRKTSGAFEQLYDRLVSNLNLVAMPSQEVLQLSSNQLALKLEKLLQDKGLLN